MHTTAGIRYSINQGMRPGPDRHLDQKEGENLCSKIIFQRKSQHSISRKTGLDAWLAYSSYWWSSL